MYPYLIIVSIMISGSVMYPYLIIVNIIETCRRL